MQKIFFDQTVYVLFFIFLEALTSILRPFFASPLGAYSNVNSFYVCVSCYFYQCAAAWCYCGTLWLGWSFVWASVPVLCVIFFIGMRRKITIEYGHNLTPKHERLLALFALGTVGLVVALTLAAFYGFGWSCATSFAVSIGTTKWVLLLIAAGDMWEPDQKQKTLKKTRDRFGYIIVGDGVNDN